MESFFELNKFFNHLINYFTISNLFHPIDIDKYYI